MAPRISSLYCLIIIASLIDCRAGECPFGCFCAFVLLCVDVELTCIVRERKCFWSVNLSWLTPCLSPLFFYHCGNEAHHPFWNVRPCPLPCHPENPAHQISDSKRRMVKATEVVILTRNRQFAHGLMTSISPEPVLLRANAMFWVPFFLKIKFIFLSSLCLLQL